MFFLPYQIQRYSKCNDAWTSFFNQNWGVKKLSYFFSSAMWKKDDYLSDAGADPRTMKSSTLLKLGLGNN